ncbi:MAG TPA: hypothetical protein VKK31_26175 [Thermoanaerobaculia bacterium]|nr:hypothetical protein [Thermoanaerobaculia bacterium]
MPTHALKEQRPQSRPAGYFAETAVGAVVLVSIQFLSLPLLVGGLALIGIVKFFSRLRTPSRP